MTHVTTRKAAALAALRKARAHREVMFANGIALCGSGGSPGQDLGAGERWSSAKDPHQGGLYISAKCVEAPLVGVWLLFLPLPRAAVGK